MHHSVQEGGDSLKSLSSVQPPGAQTNKEDIKTCKQRGKEMGSPWSSQSFCSKVSGDIAGPWTKPALL